MRLRVLLTASHLLPDLGGMRLELGDKHFENDGFPPSKIWV